MAAIINWEAVGSIAELAGAIGVMLSLLYLATQIRTSNESTKAQMEQTRLTNFTQLMLSTLAHTDLMIDGLAPGTTTETEAKRSIYFHGWLSSAQYSYNQVQRDYLHIEELERMYGLYIKYWFQHYHPFRVWWNFSRPNFQSAFAEWVDLHDSNH
jgi:hypothetical protein